MMYDLLLIRRRAPLRHAGSRRDAFFPRTSLLTVNCMCRAAARFCYAGQCPRAMGPGRANGLYVGTPS